MAACATPSSRPANAVGVACQESRPSSSSPTRLASPASRTASMSTAFEVSGLRGSTRPGILALPSPSSWPFAHRGVVPACHLGSGHLPYSLCTTSPAAPSVVCTSFCRFQSCLSSCVCKDIGQQRWLTFFYFHEPTVLFFSEQNARGSGTLLRMSQIYSLQVSGLSTLSIEEGTKGWYWEAS